MADKREEKKKKKERTPGTFAQMKQVYQMTKKSDPNIGWILSLSALGTLWFSSSSVLPWVTGLLS